MNRNDKQFIVDKIRSQYVEKQATELDTLRALDAKVKRPANIFSYIFGSIAAIVMGSGMSLVMTDIGTTIGLSGDPMIPGVIIGSIGLLMAVVNYPIYHGILSARKRKYAGEILSVSDKILGE